MSRLVLALLFLVACDARGRGCLRRAQEAAQDPMLAEVDCPGGIARCAEGHVDVSVSARRPADCRGEACACPRRAVGPCPGAPPLACVAEGVEVAVRDDTDALVRLCRLPGGFAPIAVVVGRLPDGPSDIECVHGGVRSSAQTELARCERGCAFEGDAIPATHIDPHALAHLLCAR